VVLQGRVHAAPSPRWSADVRLTHVARGEGQLGDAWQPEGTGCAAGASGCGDVDAWSLSGDVRRVWSLRLGGEYRAGPWRRAGLWARARRHELPAGVSGDEWTWALGLELSLGGH
jgi:hypothetical protein